MNKISIYILLVLIFLGLSKSFSPSEQGVPFIKSEHVFSSYFTDNPISIILEDYFKTGFLIKTYFHKYKVVHGFKSPIYVTARVSKSFFNKNLPNLGMSLFRREEREPYPSLVPMPPGFLFVGNPAYGQWKFLNSGAKVWRFHQAYKTFPDFLTWGDFKPTYEFYQRGMIYLKEDKAFYGINQEFGTNGSISSLFYKSSMDNPIVKKGFWEHFKKYIKLPQKPPHPIRYNKTNSNLGLKNE